MIYYFEFKLNGWNSVDLNMQLDLYDIFLLLTCQSIINATFELQKLVTKKINIEEESWTN
jgi:hypothetical protein